MLPSKGLFWIVCIRLTHSVYKQQSSSKIENWKKFRPPSYESQRCPKSGGLNFLFDTFLSCFDGDSKPSKFLWEPGKALFCREEFYVKRSFILLRSFSYCQGSLASQKHTLASQKHTLALPRLPHIAEVYLHRENFLALRKLMYRKSSLAFHSLSCTWGRFAGHIPVNYQIKCNTW